MSIAIMQRAAGNVVEKPAALCKHMVGAGLLFFSHAVDIYPEG
jgi:hypothetical protein